jgi:diguanylate cyclase (GGDEF)-like protein
MPNRILERWLQSPPGSERTARRSIIVLTLSFLCSMWSVFFVWSLHHRGEIDQSSRQLLDRHRAVLEMELDGVFNTLQLFLELADLWIAHHPDRDPRTDPEFVQMVERFTAASGELARIRLVGQDGSLYFPGVAAGAPLANVADREYVLEAHQRLPGSLYFGQPFVGRATGREAFPVVMQLRVPSHGVEQIFAHIDIEQLVARLYERRFLDRGEVLLLRADGVLLARAGDGSAAAVPALAAAVLAARKAGNNRGVLDVRLPGSGDGWFAYGANPRFPLLTGLTLGEREVLREWHRDVVFVLALLVFVSVVTAIGCQRALSLLQALAASRESLRVQAETDALTELCNRRRMLECCALEFERACRYRRPLSLAVFDIDLFKRVNDCHGHLAGDEALRRIAACARAEVREHDLLARWGGEEFAILMPETELAQALEVAERLREAIASMEVEVPGATIVLSVSIGVARLEAADIDVDALLRRADEALYAAKEEGRNCVRAAALPEEESGIIDE